MTQERIDTAERFNYSRGPKSDFDSFNRWQLLLGTCCFMASFDCTISSCPTTCIKTWELGNTSLCGWRESQLCTALLCDHMHVCAADSSLILFLPRRSGECAFSTLYRRSAKPLSVKLALCNKKRRRKCSASRQIATRFLTYFVPTKTNAKLFAPPIYEKAIVNSKRS